MYSSSSVTSVSPPSPPPPAPAPAAEEGGLAASPERKAPAADETVAPRDVDLCSAVLFLSRSSWPGGRMNSVFEPCRRWPLVTPATGSTPTDDVIALLMTSSLLLLEAVVACDKAGWSCTAPALDEGNAGPEEASV